MQLGERGKENNALNVIAQWMNEKIIQPLWI
jgi:hypothetical protein